MENPPPRCPRSELAGETDADLLVYMSMAAEEPEPARAAWEEFYCRHAEYLYRVCLRAYSELVGGPAGVGDLVSDAFRAAFEHAGTFRIEPAGDSQLLRLRARAWLGSIARRLVQTLLRRRQRVPIRLLAGERWQQMAGPQEAPARPSPRIEQVRQALLTLSKREQIVLRATFQWYQADKAHQRMPDDVVADLVKTLKTTPENLRQIRRRAMKRIQTLLREHAPAAPGAKP